jgi:hypothetical protein
MAAVDNPQTADAMRAGRVTPDLATYFGAAGAADPDATGDLLDLVDNGASLGEVKDEAERRRREAEGEDHKARARARAKAARFTKHWNKDEMFFFMLGVPLDDGARILAHLDVELDHVIKATRDDPARGTWENCRADAATNLLTGTTAAPPSAAGSDGPWDEGSSSTSAADAPDPRHTKTTQPENGATDAGHGPGGRPQRDQGDLFASPASAPQDTGDGPPGSSPPTATRDAAPPPTRARPTSRSRSRSGPPLKNTPSGRIVARLDVAHLWGQPGEATCEIAGIGTVSLEAMKAALPEPWVQLVITRGRDVLNVTNIGRGADLWQQAALDWTMPRCTDIGCPRDLNLQNDHRAPWTEEHITELSNIDPLCPWSHYLKTHRGYALEAGTGRRRLLPPDDPDHPNNRMSDNRANGLLADQA